MRTKNRCKIRKGMSERSLAASEHVAMKGRGGGVGIYPDLSYLKALPLHPIPPSHLSLPSSTSHTTILHPQLSSHNFNEVAGIPFLHMLQKRPDPLVNKFATLDLIPNHKVNKLASVGWLREILYDTTFIKILRFIILPDTRNQPAQPRL